MADNFDINNEGQETEQFVDFAAHDDEERDIYTQGYEDPDLKKHKKPSKVFMYAGFGIFLIVFISITVLYGKKLVQDWMPVQEDRDRGSEAQITEAAYLRALQDKKDLQDRIKTLEDDKEKIRAQIDQRITMELKRAFESLPKPKEYDTEIKDISKSISQVNESLLSLNTRIDKKEEEERLPLQGSVERSTIMPDNPVPGIQQWQADLKATEERLLEEANRPPAFLSSPGVQIGSAIQATLRTALISSGNIEENFLAVAETTSPMNVGRGYTLPAGVRFLGVVRSDFDSRRIFVTINRMQFGEVDMPVKGMLLDEKGNPGLISKYVDPLNTAAWSMLIPNLLAAAATTAQEMSSYVNNDGYLQQRPKFNAKNVALEGIGTTMEFQAQIMAEIAMRKKPVIIVREGIPVQIQISDRIPLELLMEANLTNKDHSY